MHDNLGDRMKSYETIETERRFMDLLPIYARIDGRGFSRFTKGMKRPYDPIMSELMIETTKTLIEHTHARIGYTQSDEISLCWLMENPKSEMFFAGKTQKMVSVLAALTTAAFTQALLASPYAEYISRLPHFDARVFALPNKAECANAFLWRELDATKNAVSMAAHMVYPHRILQHKTSAQMQEMLFQKGINFNDYPAFFKRGTFLRRVTELRTLTSEERARIPEIHRPSEDEKFTRSSVKVIDMPKFMSVENRVGVIFDNENPILKGDPS